jgi:hypothetical protein
MNDGQDETKAVHGNTTHGIVATKKALKVLGSRAIDARTTLGKQLKAWRQELVADLGGFDQVSVQELAIIDNLVKKKLIADSVAVYVMKAKKLVKGRRLSTDPVVEQWFRLTDSIANDLKTLGLKRRAKPTQSLGDLLAKGSAST